MQRSITLVVHAAAYLWHSIEDWCSNFIKVWKTNKVRGMMWWVAVLCYGVLILSLSRLLTWSLVGPADAGDETAGSKTLILIEWYVFVKTLILLVFIWFIPQQCLWIATCIAIYLLSEMYLYRFLTVLFRGPGLPTVLPRGRVERSILLLMFNLAEVILTFAILYRLTLSLDGAGALIQSLLVFGTIDKAGDASWLAAVQIILDFLLVAIFLSDIINRKGPPMEKNKIRDINPA